MQQGRHDEQIIRQAILNKQPVPDKIARAPILLPWLDSIYVAFTRLTTCRPTGFDLGPIPWTAIHQYASAYGWADEFDEFYRFETLIYRMDMAYLEESNRKREKATKTGTPKKARRKGR